MNKKKKPRPKPIIAYMDGIDWQHHLGHDPDALKIWSHKKGAIDEMCGPACGVVQVKVTFVKWVKKQDWSELEAESK